MTELEIRNKIKELNKCVVYVALFYIISIVLPLGYGETNIFLTATILTIAIFDLIFLVKYSLKTVILYEEVFEIFIESTTNDIITIRKKFKK